MTEVIDKCDNCNAELPDDCFVYENECFGECHGAPAWDLVPISYTCMNCGFRMEI